MSSELHLHSLSFSATQINLEKMLDFITKNAIDAGLSEQECYNVQMGSEEALVNIIHYAYPHGAGFIDIECVLHIDSYRLSIQISDKGIAFDPLSVSEPDVTTPVENRSIGGLGIFLLRRMFDHIEYSRIEGVNKLKLYKK